MGNIKRAYSVIHLEEMRKTNRKSVMMASLFVLIRLRLSKNAISYLSLEEHVPFSFFRIILVIYLPSNKAGQTCALHLRAKHTYNFVTSVLNLFICCD